MLNMARMERWTRTEIPKGDDARMLEKIWYQRDREYQGEGTREALQMLRERMFSWWNINLV